MVTELNVGDYVTHIRWPRNFIGIVREISMRGVHIVATVEFPTCMPTFVISEFRRSNQANVKW